MIPYSQIENKLEDKVEFKATSQVLEKDPKTREMFIGDSSYKGIVPERYAVIGSKTAKKRKGERTFYTKYDNEEVAVKFSKKRKYSFKDRVFDKASSRMETPLREARMLNAARENNIEVAEPLLAAYNPRRESVQAGVNFVIKNAGKPKNGEVPYWLTDLAKLKPHFDDSTLESHINSSFKRTLSQLKALRENGMVHRSITPLSHHSKDPFSVYKTDQWNIRGFEKEVNITPTGELKDFEHVSPRKSVRLLSKELLGELTFHDSFRGRRAISYERKRRKFTDFFGDTIAETTLSYAFTAREAGLGLRAIRDTLRDGLEEEGNPEEISEYWLEDLARKSEELVETGQMSSKPLQKIARKYTGDSNIPVIGG